MWKIGLRRGGTDFIVSRQYLLNAGHPMTLYRDAGSYERLFFLMGHKIVVNVDRSRGAYQGKPDWHTFVTI